jgi:hypothetical protein
MLLENVASLTLPPRKKIGVKEEGARAEVNQLRKVFSVITTVE